MCSSYYTHAFVAKDTETEGGGEVRRYDSVREQSGGRTERETEAPRRTESGGNGERVKKQKPFWDLDMRSVAPTRQTH